MEVHIFWFSCYDSSPGYLGMTNNQIYYYSHGFIHTAPLSGIRTKKYNLELSSDQSRVAFCVWLRTVNDTRKKNIDTWTKYHIKNPARKVLSGYYENNSGFFKLGINSKSRKEPRCTARNMSR